VYHILKVLSRGASALNTLAVINTTVAVNITAPNIKYVSILLDITSDIAPENV